MSSACINPVVYGYLNETYRKEFIDIFRKLRSMLFVSLGYLGLVSPATLGLMEKDGEANQNFELNQIIDGRNGNGNGNGGGFGGLGGREDDSDCLERKGTINGGITPQKAGNVDETEDNRRASGTSLTMLTVSRVGDAVAVNFPGSNPNPANAVLNIETIQEEVSDKFITSADLKTEGSRRERELSLKRLKKTLEAEQPRIAYT